MSKREISQFFTMNRRRMENKTSKYPGEFYVFLQLNKRYGNKKVKFSQVSNSWKSSQNIKINSDAVGKGGW
jgi:hypothetical protein